LRKLQHPTGRKRFAFGRLRTASQHPRQQPHHGIDHHSRRQRAVRQHIVADRQLIRDQPLAHPLIHALVLAANEDQMSCLRKRPGVALRKLPSLRGHQDDPRIRRPHRLDRLKQRLRLQDHAGAAAIGPIIRRATRILRKIPQIHDTNDRRAHARSPFQHALFEEPPKHARKKRDHIDAQTFAHRATRLSRRHSN